ncbi:hypothetical protein cand_012380 [Cryptosporidium andersoni]|uniref:Uncharacterized protein n=1 Tax=Cryptosporidium andersoni TaxID=117008 RepID=A0A1J4MGG9_9CRYT|nr:hypothetical protein cand_012380 [Cryptosporidium andersoni]
MLFNSIAYIFGFIGALVPCLTFGYIKKVGNRYVDIDYYKEELKLREEAQTLFYDKSLSSGFLKNISEQKRNIVERKDNQELILTSKNDNNHLDNIKNSSITKEYIAVAHNFFPFPVHKMDNGFTLTMGILLDKNITYPINIKFIGRNQQIVISLFIEDCKIYAIAPRNNFEIEPFDSSPLPEPISTRNKFELLFLWDNKKYEVIYKNSRLYIPLISIVNTRSALIAYGIAFSGKLEPLDILWNYKDRYLNQKYICNISNYEDRCKSSEIVFDTKNTTFNGWDPNISFLKLAFQYPSINTLPIQLNIEDINNEIVVTAMFYQRNMTINLGNKETKLITFNKNYVTNEWINIDLFYLTSDYHEIINDRRYKAKNFTNYTNIMEFSTNTSQSCIKTIQGNYNLFKQINEEIKVQNSKKYFEIEDINQRNKYYLYFGVNDELIGIILLEVFKPHYIYFSGINTQTNSKNKYVPLVYWRLKGGLPIYLI